MRIGITIIPRLKYTAYLLLIIILSFKCEIVLGQEYTVTDSITFQRSLAASSSDADRINYQLKLADYFIRKSSGLKADQEIAKAWISRAKKLNEKLKSGEAEGHILFEEGSLLQVDGPSSKASDMISKAIELLKNSTDKCLLANAYKGLFIYYDANNPKQSGKKEELINQSLTLYNQCGDRLEEGLTLLDQSEMYLFTGNFPLALKALNESQAKLSAIHYKKLQRLYGLFGNYYFTQSDYANSLKYQYKALEICKQMKDSSALYCITNNMIGLSLIDLKQYSQAITYLNEALLISQKNNDTTTIFPITLNLSSCYIYINKPQESLRVLDNIRTSYRSILNEINDNVIFHATYLFPLEKLHQYEKADQCARELLNLINQPGVNKFNITNSYQSLFRYYYRIKDYDKALICLTNDDKIIGKNGTPNQKERSLKAWYTLDSARQNYKGAFSHLLQYKALEDSIFNEKKSQQIQQLQIKYETQKKEDNIKILTQNAKISEAQLKTAQLIRNVTLGVIIIIIVIGGLQYRRYREKQKISLLITEKNIALQKLVTEKEWLLKEVHHRVKNNLHTVICLLESQAAYLEDDALKAIENSRHRIYAMSLIHQKLYQSDDIKVVDMKIYLTEFVDYLKESFGSPEHIQIILSTESIKLGAGQAIPIGLIINETINNAFKYAFPTQQRGEIKVELKRIGEEIHLSVADNGIGFKQQADQETRSLGLELIKGLTLDLRGTINLDTNNGTSIRIHFMIDGLV